jgi:hypothetical protein
MKQTLQSIAEYERMKHENIVEMKKIRIEKEKNLLKYEINMELDIEELKDSIKNAYRGEEKKIVLIPMLIIPRKLIFCKQWKCSCNDNRHKKEKCELMQLIEDTYLERMDKNGFDIKMNFYGEITDKRNDYVLVWKIYLEFEVE